VIFAKETFASVLSIVEKNLLRWATLVDSLRFILVLEIEKKAAPFYRPLILQYVTLNK
jgi:hypothetical protein